MLTAIKISLMAEIIPNDEQCGKGHLWPPKVSLTKKGDLQPHASALVILGKVIVLDTAYV